jgi:hypothetical protein
MSARRHKRARALGEQLGLFGRATGRFFMTLTFPTSMYEALKDRATFNRACKEGSLVVEHWLRDRFYRGRPVKQGVKLVPHPTRKDETEWSPHLHLLVPRLALDMKGVWRSANYRSRMFSNAALRDLSSRWADALHSLLKIPCDEAIADARYVPATNVDREQVDDYLERTQPGFKTWTQKTRSYGLLATRVVSKLPPPPDFAQWVPRDRYTSCREMVRDPDTGKSFTCMGEETIKSIEVDGETIELEKNVPLGDWVRFAFGPFNDKEE